MSVKVSGLTKIYGNQKAIDSLDFEIQKGEIIGFLGPNGAGKTTTMKILTGFMPANHGVAEICGFNIEENGSEVRQLIGYLPEHNPLYKEMYVKEYLGFVADVMGLSDKRNRVQEMIEKTGLQREQHKQISSLSKGYRQRVGLAQAMIHDPEVLILDEPTSGLDPNQLLEIRALIKEFGKEKTVIFSSHIMQEVQALCDRVIILNKGKIIADDPIDQLKGRTKETKILNLTFNSKIDLDALNKIEGVIDCKSISNFSYQLELDSNEDLRPIIFKEIVKNNWILIEMKQEELSVENIFQELTSDV